jgi:death on curing protein
MIRFLSYENAFQQLSRLGFMVKDAGLLDSALARPKTTVFGEFAYPSIELMAAAMHQSLVKNHPLMDGNKRTAWTLLVSFLLINDIVIEMTTDEGMDFTLGVAEGRYGLEEAAELIRRHIRAY